MKAKGLSEENKVGKPIFQLKLKCLEAHNALNDTLNTVSVLRCLDFVKGIRDQYEYYYAAAM